MKAVYATISGPRVRATGRNMEKNGFFETAVAQRIETFGNIAHVFSTYESRHAPGEKPYARGVNSFQLVRQDGACRSGFSLTLCR